MYRIILSFAFIAFSLSAYSQTQLPDSIITQQSIYNNPWKDVSKTIFIYNANSDIIEKLH
ncbi:MAG: hypothetical protein CL663_03900 [Bacteroidetes bacterium]|nr:hypothetical protein [Bacteroidota bacterium]